MGLVPMQEMAAHALRQGYAVGAYNVYDWDTLFAVLEAAEKEDSPAIVQLSMGARKHVPGFALFFRSVQEAAMGCKAPIAIQHDHCGTMEAATQALQMGFTAVMFDGSHLPYEENRLKTAQITKLAHERGAWLEAELGSIPGFEDMVYSGNAESTDPRLAAQFVEATGCDALAVSVGTSHGGVRAGGPLPFHHSLLKDIHLHLPDYPLVLHGAASLPKELIQAVNDLGGAVETVYNCSEADIAQAGNSGVFKLNMDVDNQLAWNAAVRRDLLENSGRYDPRPILRAGREAFRDEVCHKMRYVSGTAEKSWLGRGAEKEEVV